MYAHTCMHTDTQIHTYTPANIYMHRHRQTYIHHLNTCTQFAHNMHTHNTDTEHRNNMQHIEDNREENTEQDNTENNTYTSTENSAHNFSTYSFDLYHEFVAIKNSNTIELYTISK